MTFRHKLCLRILFLIANVLARDEWRKEIQDISQELRLFLKEVDA